MLFIARVFLSSKLVTFFQASGHGEFPNDWEKKFLMQSVRSLPTPALWEELKKRGQEEKKEEDDVSLQTSLEHLPPEWTEKMNEEIKKELDKKLEKIKKSSLLGGSKKIGRTKEKKEWSLEDGKILEEIVRKYKCDWKKIEKRMGNLRKEKRSIPFLQKKLALFKEGKKESVKFDFTKQEDEKLLGLFLLHSRNWNEISKYFPDRNALSLKNRYYYSAGRINWLYL